MSMRESAVHTTTGSNIRNSYNVPVSSHGAGNRYYGYPDTMVLGARESGQRASTGAPQSMVLVGGELYAAVLSIQDRLPASTLRTLSLRRASEAVDASWS